MEVMRAVLQTLTRGITGGLVVVAEDSVELLGDSDEGRPATQLL